METTFPWYHYQILQMMYNAYPFFPDQNNPYLNNLLNYRRIDSNQNDISIMNNFNKNEEITPETHQFTPITLKLPADQLSSKKSQALICFRQKSRRPKKQASDQNQYVPIRKISQTSSTKSNNASLNENRNILPNAIHQILSYVQRKNKSQKIVEKLIDKYFSSDLLNQEDSKFQDPETPEISSARFYAYQNQMKAKMPNYVKLDTFKYMCTEQSIESKSEVFSVREQMIYNKICRTVIIYYLKQQLVCVIMSSKRMQKDKKKEHLKVNRRIQSYIRSGFKEEEE